ncbi:hypothetical protein [Candidatus Uabimicrobium sp. HlEnr_7]|uniref:hypothetical protein n=1 Tax=Candidatus Uabimicrobium helgolandensis TaxID=3095367 RepID=UPI00355912FB
MLRTLCVLTLSFVLIGCVSYRAYEKDTSRPAHQHVKKKDLKGLAIAAEDYSSAKKSEKYFNRNLRDYGYLPIYLSFANDSDYEYTVRQGNISLSFEDGSQAQLVETKTVIENTQNSYGRALLGIPLLIFPAFIIGSSVSSANYDLEKDYNAKSLRDFNILKDEKVFGFVFFKLPSEKSNASLNDAIIKINVVKKAKQSEMAETLEGILSLSTD